MRAGDLRDGPNDRPRFRNGPRSSSRSSVPESWPVISSSVGGAYGRREALERFAHAVPEGARVGRSPRPRATNRPAAARPRNGRGSPRTTGRRRTTTPRATPKTSPRTTAPKPTRRATTRRRSPDPGPGACRSTARRATTATRPRATVCDDRCRAELTSGSASEVEPNDDATGANVVQLEGGSLTVACAST